MSRLNFKYFGIAWAVGSVVYLIAAMLTVVDGIISLIFQPIIAIVISFVCVAVCRLAGILLRLPFLQKAWSRQIILPKAVALLGVGLLMFSAMPSQIVIHTQDIDSGPEQYEESFQTLGDTAIPGYFALLFALVNWPTRGRSGDDVESPA